MGLQRKKNWKKTDDDILDVIAEEEEVLDNIEFMLRLADTLTPVRQETEEEILGIKESEKILNKCIYKCYQKHYLFKSKKKFPYYNL